MSQDIRWEQRFQNFDRSVSLLREPMARGVDHLSMLEKEGVAHRFELLVELAWKTMKDFLEHEGAVIQPATPRAVIKAAFAAGMISDGQVWIDMLDHRNLLSHTYDAATFEQVIVAIRDRYLAAIGDLHAWLVGRRSTP